MKGEVCSVEGCTNEAMARGWCNTCYNRWWNRQTPSNKRLRRYRCRDCGSKDLVWDVCSADPGCDEPVYASEMCKAHYNRWWRRQQKAEAEEEAVADDGFWDQVDRYTQERLASR